MISRVILLWMLGASVASAHFAPRRVNAPHPSGFYTATAPGYPRSLQQTIDKRGLVTQYEYDGNGNVTNTVVMGDLTGDGIATQSATNTAVYNANCLPVQMTDPAGNGVQIVYDAVFNYLPQQVIRFSGTAPVSTNIQYYGNATNVAVDGSLTQTNLTFGLMTRQVRAANSPDAATNDWAYNGNGFLTESIRYSGTTDPNVVTTYFYNERGQMETQADSLGAYIYRAYDAMGRPIEQDNFDEFGNDLSWNFVYYDDNGEVNWTEGPRYNPENYVNYQYDGAGRCVTEIRWRSQANATGDGVTAPGGYNLYAQTFHEYDPLGNLLLTVDPRGAMTTNVYDPLCRLVQTTSYDTNEVTVLSNDGFSYEPGGEEQSHTNGLGGVTTTIYTTQGRPESRANPDGSTDAWRYYLDGRPYRKYQCNGAYWQINYDDVNRITTGIFCSASGVPEATNSVQRDRRGNVMQRIDEGGNVFTTLHDGLNRVKASIGPAITNVVYTYPGGNPAANPVYVTNVMSQTMTNYFDAAGRVVTNVNALGEQSITFMDALHRVTTNLLYGANGTLVRERYATYSPDHNSVTVTDGSGASAITHTTWTDTDNHPVLSIAYPSVNATEYAQNQYDLSGNLVSTLHNSFVNGVITNWTTSTVTYDGLNRPTSKTDRDGALTTYARDLLGDVTNCTIPGGVQMLASFNNAGQKLADWLVGSGGSVTRSNSYTYYGSSSPWPGLLATKTDGRGVVCTYYYDDRLRLATNVYTGPLPEDNLTTIRQYEVRGYVTNYSERFASTNAGSTTTVQRSFDPYGQLVSESVNGGVVAYMDRQTWDAAGRRSMLGFGAGADYGYQWQADGSLIYASDPTGSGAYSFNTAGILTKRQVGNRITSIGSLDGEGRPLVITNILNAVPELIENLSWSGDGLLTSHTLVRDDANLATDNRSYSYANQSRRVTQERLSINNSTTWTNSFIYDRGTNGGPGALTTTGPVGSSFGLWWSGLLDSFSRVNAETNNSIGYLAYGWVNGQSTLFAWLDSQPIQIMDVGTNMMQWRTFLELSQGAHTLQVNALHPSGFYTASATNTFTNEIPNEVTHDSYDGGGNITNRVWINASGATNRTQSLTWDAEGRLLRVIELNPNNYGFNWSAVYDGFGRRLSTTTMLVSNGIPSAVPPQVLSSYFDPQVEFQELGVTLSSAPDTEFLEAGTSPSTQTTWKLYGPDLNGVYGGENGTGGLDAVSPYQNTFNPVISDSRGNVLAEVTNGVASWTLARPTAYGAVPGYRPVAFGDGVDFAQSCAWHGREVDVTGYYNLGLRILDPTSGQWLSYDPMWNDGDPNGQSFCGGDPVNHGDWNGTIANDFYGSVLMQNPAYSLPGGPSFIGSVADYFQGWGGGSAEQVLFGQALQSLYPNEQLGSEFGDLTPQQRGVAENLMSYALGESDYFNANQVNTPGFSLSDTLLNTSARNEAAAEWNNADWTSGWGITMKVASGFSYTANTISAGANFIPVIGAGKAILGDVARSAIAAVTESFSKNAAEEITGGLVPTLQGNVPNAVKWINNGGSVSYGSEGITYTLGDGTAVTYNNLGFPNFSPYLYNGSGGLSQVTIDLTWSRAWDEAAANAAAGFDETPIGYTWHHNENVGLMQLIEEDVHSSFPHTGGFSLGNQ